jgi:hypothetical protein
VIGWRDTHSSACSATAGIIAESLLLPLAASPPARVLYCVWLT